jgi:BirA family biotin operon repressor/biotin-[acetyl-CoA-carboxylase] ligase
MPELLRTPPLIATPLVTHIVGSRVIVYETITSTNDRALRLGGDGTVIVAEMQTAGRGRHGRAWHSRPGKGLYFSVAFDRPTEGLAFAAPLAVRDALASVVETAIKWPNDVLIDGKKVCGVLVEARQGRIVVGIGINVHHRAEDFPEGLRARATSIEAATGIHVDRGELLRDVLTRLDERVVAIRGGHIDQVFNEWAELCGVVGRRLRCASCEGIVQFIDTDGALVIASAEGPKRVMLGEIVELEGS